ncbi:MAG TPA: hypothetical protein VNK91_02035 [Burkholderiaceae bacterium]|nr:hypothetical protein [Burkholderiaceae bacterium]
MRKNSAKIQRKLIAAIVLIGGGILLALYAEGGIAAIGGILIVYGVVLSTDAGRGA